MRSPLPSRPAPASPPPPRKFTQQAALQLCLSGTGVTQPPSTKRATAGQPRYSRTGRSPSRLRNRARPTGRLNRLRGNAANACYHWPRRQPATVTSNHPTIGMIMSPAQHGSDRGIAPPIRSATRSRLTLTELAPRLVFTPCVPCTVFTPIARLGHITHAHTETYPTL